MSFFGTQIAGKKFRHGAAQECQKACELQVFLFDDIDRHRLHCCQESPRFF